MATKKEKIQKENDWTRKIGEKLKQELDTNQYEISCLSKIPYAVNINNVALKDVNFREYEVDLLIQEKCGNKLIPRLVIESKYETITTHDAITYSAKAKAHKALFAGLRYGLMIGASNEKKIGSRVIYHGTEFDFMIAFSEDDPNATEWNKFVEIVKRNLALAPILENLMNEKGKKKYSYSCIEKDIKFS